MGRYGEEEEEEGIEIILPEIVPELFPSNKAWIVYNKSTTPCFSVTSATLFRTCPFGNTRFWKSIK